VVRIEAAGLLEAIFAGNSARLERLQAWDQQIRQPMGGVYKIGFGAIDGAVGVTTLAQNVLQTLIAQRPGPHLAVDLDTDSDRLARNFDLDAPIQPSSARAQARTSEEATADLPRGADNCFVYRPAQLETGAIRAWFEEIVPIVRFFDTVITDFGQCDPANGLISAIRTSDVFCLVAGAHRREAEIALSLANGLKLVPNQPHVVIALVDREGRGSTGARLLVERSDFPVIVIPHEHDLATANLSLPFRLAIRQLSATLFTAPQPARRSRARKVRLSDRGQ